MVALLCALLQQSLTDDSLRALLYADQYFGAQSASMDVAVHAPAAAAAATGSRHSRGPSMFGADSELLTMTDERKYEDDYDDDDDEFDSEMDRRQSLGIVPVLELAVRCVTCTLSTLVVGALAKVRATKKVLLAPKASWTLESPSTSGALKAPALRVSVVRLATRVSAAALKVASPSSTQPSMRAMSAPTMAVPSLTMLRRSSMSIS